MKFPRWVPTVVAIALGWVGFWWFVARGAQPQFDPDSYGYLKYASDIADGTFFQSRRGLDVPLERATRTPGYPALLALTQFLPGAGGKAQPLVLHATIALATLAAVPLLLRQRVGVFISVGAVLLVQHLSRDYFRFVMTEWLCLHLLLAIAALWGGASTGEKGARFTLARGLVAALAVIVRPAVIVLLPLALLHQLVVDRRPRELAKFTTSLGAPLLALMLLNAATVGSFSITDFGGFSLFGVAGCIGSPAPQPADSTAFTALRETANIQKRPPAGQEAGGVRGTLREGYAFFATCYDHNTWLVGRKYAEANRIPYVDANRLLGQYATRTLRENFARYGYYIAVSMREAVRLQIPWTWPLVALASLAAAAVFFSRQSPAALWHLAVACLGFAAIHAAHVLLCSATGFMLGRYQMLTAGPWLASCLLFIGGGLKVAARGGWLTTTSARR